MTGERCKLIGYWMSEKKIQKLNWTEFSNVCRNHGFELVKVDLQKPLDIQGPFVVFLHKLTDIIALANQGDPKERNRRLIVVILERQIGNLSNLLLVSAKKKADGTTNAVRFTLTHFIGSKFGANLNKSRVLMTKIESWIMRNPYMKILDPLDNVQKLLDRYLSYSIVHKSDLFQHGVFTPTFAEITSQNTTETIEELTKCGVQYPFICKPSVAHGSKQAHKMCIIFHEKYLSDCKPPCVAQSFINHNAILYKIFIIGNKHFVVERPSLRNFYPANRETIFFDSQDVSKADSRSTLSVLDPEDLNLKTMKPDPERLNEIVNTIRKELGMSLLGVDVIIENSTGKYAIIDINAYPGYDGFPNFFEALVRCIEDTINSSQFLNGLGRSQSLDLDQDSGFDTGDSSDERVKFKTLNSISNHG